MPLIYFHGYCFSILPLPCMTKPERSAWYENGWQDTEWNSCQQPATNTNNKWCKGKWLHRESKWKRTKRGARANQQSKKVMHIHKVAEQKPATMVHDASSHHVYYSSAFTFYPHSISRFLSTRFACLNALCAQNLTHFHSNGIHCVQPKDVIGLVCVFLFSRSLEKSHMLYECLYRQFHFENWLQWLCVLSSSFSFGFFPSSVQNKNGYGGGGGVIISKH